MSFKPFTWIRRGFGYLWSTVDAARRLTLNLLFLIIFIAIVWAIVGGGAKPLQDKTALVLDLKGAIVEQHSSTAREALLANVGGGDVRRSVQLRDILTALDAAAKDPKISSVVLLLDEMRSGGIPMLHDVGAALERVKQAGKPVIAWGGGYDQKQYLIAVHATKVYLHPMGIVYLDGFGRYRNYYRDALDKLGVTVNVMKVGTYKSFAEQYIGNGPSPAAKEAESFLYNAVWEGYTAEVEKFRKLPAGSIARGIEELPKMMEEAKGDTGKLALNAKLVDGLMTRDEVRKYMIEIGSLNSEGTTFRQIGFEDYLARQHAKPFGEGIAVVVAQGEISDGNVGPGSIGGMSTASLIRRAREDDQMKAIVLRVDSPGGSPYGSELIRRELELARMAGKPVVVSMSSVAASGGYWISMAADEVIADPSTITGSIGVFALLPTAEKVVDKLGIHTAGVTTTWLADATNPLRPLDPRFAGLIQSSINHIYDDFTMRAAQARKTTPAKIDEVAQGRVWTGAQAQERGLVDTLGGYQDALRSAASRAKLTGDYRIAYIERDTSRFERLLGFFGVSSQTALSIEVKLGLSALPAGAAAGVVKDMNWLSELAETRKPFAAMTHCLCAIP
jgi:protease-4